MIMTRESCEKEAFVPLHVCFTFVKVTCVVSHHVQLPFVLHKAGDSVGRQYTGSQGEVGVDHSLELS